MKDLQLVASRIREAFRDVPPPEPDAIIEQAYDEHEAAFAKGLQNYTWANLDAEFAETYCQEIALLMPSAFAYYLPGLMLLSLEDHKTSFQGELVTYVTYGLTDDEGRPSSRDYLKERLFRFSTQQLSTIKDFLVVLMSHEQFEFEKPDMLRTVRLIDVLAKGSERKETNGKPK